VKTIPYGKLDKFIFSWKLGLTVFELQNAEEMIAKLKVIVKEIDDITTASYRFTDYNFFMKLDSRLTVEAVPTDSGDDDFKFIIGQNGRTISVDSSEVSRFFSSRGCRVTSMIEKDSDYESDITINISGGDQLVTSQNYTIKTKAMSDFVSLFNLEYSKSDMDRSIVASNGAGGVTLYTDDEKTYLEVV
jgi:hypothetical protein